MTKLLEKEGFKFPWNKKDAIIVHTHHVKDSNNPVFPVRSGECDNFEAPDFAKHPEAWFVGNIEVEVGDVADGEEDRDGNRTGEDRPMVHHFKQMVVDAFNLASGNMLKKGNTLTWNIWCTAPDYVDQKEWKDHATKWRHSIDVDHRSPGGARSDPKYFDGTEFHAAVEKDIFKNLFQSFLSKHEK